MNDRPYPRIVRTGQTTTLRLKNHDGFSDHPYIAELYPIEGVPGQTNWRPPQELELTQTARGPEIDVPFETEQEYALVLRGKRGEEVELRIYALDEDLFSLRPFKGDTHIHSDRSDGREPPAYVAACARRIGLDFMAVTDHRKYAPSLEAIEAFEDLPIDLRIYPGEEVHPPRLPLVDEGGGIGSPVHIINFGGAFSINERMRDEQGSYPDDLRALVDGMENVPDGVDAEPYAACVWAFDKIREGGGLGVFCHPYWFTRHRYDVPATLTDMVFERQPYDAYELIGGYHPFEVTSNHLQVMRYCEERAAGKKIPIVGASDAHGCETGELFGWYYTLVFAPSAALEDLIPAIKGFNSVAVEALPGQAPRAYGPMRLVKYAQFLLREVFPEHDTLCRQEGALMAAHLAGDADAEGQLAAMRGQTAALLERMWAAD